MLCHGRRGAVQSELGPRAPTPWTSRYARRPADTAAACSPSAVRVIAAMPTAHCAAGRPAVAGRCGLPRRDISRVPRAVSTIATSSAVYRRVVTLAGESAQVDWGSFGKVRIGQGTRTVSGFVMVLGYSRALAALFTLDQTLESFLRGHVAAFDALGGAARNLVYDNLRSAVLDRRGAAVQFHPRLLELAGHYHFAPRPCTPGRGNEKGKIERKIQYLRHAYFAARPFRDLDDINTQFRRWRDEVAHRRPHPDQLDRSVADVWDEEKPRLLPLPAQSLRDRPGARRPLRQDALRPLRPQSLLDPPHPRPQAADPARFRHPRPHPRPTDRAGQPSPHLQHRTDRRGPRASGRPARRHPPGQRPHHPRPAPAPPSPPPPRSSSGSPNGERRCARTPPGCSHCSTTTDPQELAKPPFDIALERDALGAGSITHILETRRRQRGLKPPLRLTLPDRPGLRDFDVRPHDLETYDALGQKTPDDTGD